MGIRFAMFNSETKLDNIAFRPERHEEWVLADDSRWFSVRIIPYCRLDNMIDGVVITLVDITTTKNLEAALRRESNP